MKVLFLDMDNLQNNFYNFARFARARGVDSFVMLPLASEMIREHRPEWSAVEPAAAADPEWVLRAAVPRAPQRDPIGYWAREHSLVGRLRAFDIIVCSGLGLPWARSSGRPFVYISFGPDLDQIAVQGWSGNPRDYADLGPVKRLGYWLRRRRFRQALPRASVGIVAPHQFASARSLGIRDFAWMNHVIDLELFQPLSAAERSRLRQELAPVAGADHVVLLASRQAWLDATLTDYKGTDLALHALAAVRGRLPGRLRILLVEKGWDVEATRTLLRELRLDDVCAWLAPVPRRELARLYQAADVVLDQFGVGILALVAVEAMASGAAVLTKLPEVPGAPFYAEPPHFAHAASEADLGAQLIAVLTNESERSRRAALGADWANRNCRPEVGIQQLLNAICRALPPLARS